MTTIRPLWKVKRLVDKEVYAASRKEWCEIPTCSNLTAGGSHHVIPRSCSGPDHPYNLISLCVVCHTKAHDGNIPRSLQFAIVARREGVEAEELISTINRIRRGGCD